MPLTTCPDCHQPVSPRATSCPHCGAPLRTLADKIFPNESKAPVRGFFTQLILKWLAFALSFGVFAAIGANLPMPAGAGVMFLGAVIGMILVYWIQNRYYRDL
jgi:zinc-ribbon domain